MMITKDVFVISAQCMKILDFRTSFATHWLFTFRNHIIQIISSQHINVREIYPCFDYSVYVRHFSHRQQATMNLVTENEQKNWYHICN